MGVDWYAYVYNLQGDVIALTNNSGSVVVAYSYDAWGKPLGVTGTLATTLGRLNPFRYRGYVWDEETGLYYLRSRYYRSEHCRFLIGDRIITDNIYQYGHNTPINGIDSDGEIFTMGVYARSYSFFHDIVKNAIAEANQGMLTEVHPSRNSRSRIDLVKGTEMYEVKPDKLEYRYIGLLQLLSYAIEGADSGYRLGETALTIPQIPEIVRAHEIITITVRQDGPLIYYKVSRRLKEPKSRPSTQIATNPQIVASAIVATAMVCATLLRGCGGGGGKFMYCKDLNHR